MVTASTVQLLVATQVVQIRVLPVHLLTRLPYSSPLSSKYHICDHTPTILEKILAKIGLILNHYREITARLNELAKGSGNASSMSTEERADALNLLFTERVSVLLRDLSNASIQAQIEEQLYYQ